MKMRKDLLKIRKKAYVLNLSSIPKDNMVVGKSKIGGCPDLPHSIEWPNGYAFIGQINIAELNDQALEEYDLKSGILYFFYDFDDETYEYSDNLSSNIQVFYFEGDLNELKPTDYPQFLDDEYQIPEFDVTFTERMEVPMYEEYFESVNTDIDWDEYDDLVEELDLGHDDECEITKLLGYADLIQGSMISSCKNAYQNEEDEWILLFQVDTISNEDFEIAFGEYGRLYYYIRKKDLREKKFDNCWYAVQFS